MARKIYNSHRYLLEYIPTSPMADSRGYVPVHRKIMSEKIGRPITKSEIVHHINGDSFDNRIENLQLLTANEHDAIHGVEHARKYLHKKYPHVCKLCGIHYESGPNSKFCSIRCINKWYRINHKKSKPNKL